VAVKVGVLVLEDVLVGLGVNVTGGVRVKRRVRVRVNSGVEEGEMAAGADGTGVRISPVGNRVGDGEMIEAVLLGVIKYGRHEVSSNTPITRTICCTARTHGCGWFRSLGELYCWEALSGWMILSLGNLPP
jgi:hypothetical protein